VQDLVESFEKKLRECGLKIFEGWSYERVAGWLGAHVEWTNSTTSQGYTLLPEILRFEAVQLIRPCRTQTCCKQYIGCESCRDSRSCTGDESMEGHQALRSTRQLPQKDV